MKKKFFLALSAISLWGTASATSLEILTLKSANAQVSCQCVVYVQNVIGQYIPIWHAKEAVSKLAGLGYTRIDTPVKGAIVVMQPSFPGANTTSGHIGFIENYDAGNGKISVRGSNQSGGVARMTEAGCNNVKVTPFGASIKGHSDISFWIKGTTSISFAAPVSSRLTITPSSVDLTISAGNLNGKTVYVQTWRPAVNGYPARYFKPQQLTATGNTTVTFNDLDEPGSTIAGVTYYTVASLEPISPGEAEKQRTSCFTATGGKFLCDAVRR